MKSFSIRTLPCSSWYSVPRSLWSNIFNFSMSFCIWLIFLSNSLVSVNWWFISPEDMRIKTFLLLGNYLNYLMIAPLDEKVLNPANQINPNFGFGWSNLLSLLMLEMFIFPNYGNPGQNNKKFSIFGIKWYLPSIRSFFWDRMVSCFFKFSTSLLWSSFSCVNLTNSLWSLSHICWSSPISACSASIDFCRELIWISKGPISTPCE